jgi:ABC-type multidrug transport system fused ATPase/permease subunit
MDEATGKTNNLYRYIASSYVLFFLFSSPITASIDTETDEFIQLMIRTKFADCTVLTIAHRLDTIVDSTKVLVMDAGIVGEYDTPKVLLDKTDGIFKGLWQRHVNGGGRNI